MDIKIPNRITAKQAREQGTNKIHQELTCELSEIYEEIQAHKKELKVTLYGKSLSPDAKKILEDDGYIVLERQTGMNEYSTVIKW